MSRNILYAIVLLHISIPIHSMDWVMQVFGIGSTASTQRTTHDKRHQNRSTIGYIITGKNGGSSSVSNISGNNVHMSLEIGTFTYEQSLTDGQNIECFSGGEGSVGKGTYHNGLVVEPNMITITNKAGKQYQYDYDGTSQCQLTATGFTIGNSQFLYSSEERDNNKSTLSFMKNPIFILSSVFICFGSYYCFRSF